MTCRKRSLAYITAMVSALAFLALTVGMSGCAPEEQKPKYAVIAAMEIEVDLLRDELQDMRQTELLGVPTYEGTIGGCDVVVMQCGIGKVSAGIGTQALIDTYHPDYIINTGCAGALSPALGVGDVVLSESVAEWDLDLRPVGYPIGYIDALGYVEMQASAELCDRIETAAPAGQKISRGMVVSGDQFVSTNEQRKIILDNFPDALCAEMEGAAVGHVCMQNGIPFCIIRTMSDNANGDSGTDYAAFSVEASRNSAKWLIAMFQSIGNR